jgi:hypothetical protein
MALTGHTGSGADPMVRCTLGSLMARNARSVSHVLFVQYTQPDVGV